MPHSFDTHSDAASLAATAAAAMATLQRNDSQEQLLSEARAAASSEATFDAAGERASAPPLSLPLPHKKTQPVDGVFQNMHITNAQGALHAEPPPKKSVLNAAAAARFDDELPKYDEIAHLAPPKYTDVCRTSISDDASVDYNDVELHGTSVGGYDVFIGFCLLTVLFNVVGFFVSILLTDSYAGKYGACFGLGILIALSGVFNFPFSFVPSDGTSAPTEAKIGIGAAVSPEVATGSLLENELVSKAFSLSFFFLGVLICALCVMFYRKTRNDATQYTEIGLNV